MCVNFSTFCARYISNLPFFFFDALKLMCIILLYGATSSTVVCLQKKPCDKYRKVPWLYFFCVGFLSQNGRPNISQQWFGYYAMFRDRSVELVPISTYFRYFMKTKPRRLESINQSPTGTNDESELAGPKSASRIKIERWCNSKIFNNFLTIKQGCSQISWNSRRGRTLPVSVWSNIWLPNWSTWYEE
jgi:hypothetical protein